ncbi:hypothetical protein [Streptomyces subrutilus]|uniref:hypothetical protein n=1 Tax=Streptomyces subrutilus TaxID=36818 RepID=UPI000AC8632A|nr:hypothetical protein [Streptomyces subrutilus]
MRLVARVEGVELMAGKRLTNPAGSSNDLRGDVLRVLGVLKVATADQVQRIASPHLTYRHTTKASASEQKTARTASHAARSPIYASTVSPRTGAPAGRGSRCAT